MQAYKPTGEAYQVVVCISVLSGRLGKNHIFLPGSPHYQLDTSHFEVLIIQVVGYHLKIACFLCGRPVYHLVRQSSARLFRTYVKLGFEFCAADFGFEFCATDIFHSCT